METIKKDILEKIVQDYMFCKNEITVKEIIEKYKLNILPSNLKKMLPLGVSEKKCPYCDIPMKMKIVNRGEYGDAFCEECEHIDFANKYSHRKYIKHVNKEVCRCKQCDDEREKAIQLVYNNNKEKVCFSDIPTGIQIVIVRMLEKIHFTSFDVIKGNVIYEYRNDLKKIGLIAVSPTSPIHAFVLDENFPNSYYPDRVSYEWQISFSDAEKEKLIKGDYFLNKLNVEEKAYLFRCYMHKDVMTRFTELMKERGLQLEILPTAEESFKELYNELSYSEIITLCFQVARYCLDQTKTGKMYRKVAEKGAVKMAVSFWENTKKKGWLLAKSEVGYCGEELRWFVKNVLKKDLNILNFITPCEVE